MRKYALYVIIIVICFLGGIQVSEARRQRLALPSGKRATEKMKNATELNKQLLVSYSDSLLFPQLAASIGFNGYDKKANASKESFFISNNGNDTLSFVKIEIRYLTVNGRELHTREVEVNTILPPGTTRKADIKSWDTQKSFYYYKSSRPRTSATPYKVIFRVLEVGIIQNQQ